MEMQFRQWLSGESYRTPQARQAPQVAEAMGFSIHYSGIVTISYSSRSAEEGPQSAAVPMLLAIGTMADRKGAKIAG
jgi:hypothetical protein